MEDYQKTWNDRYGGSDFLFGKIPNEYFKSKLDTLTQGKLFLPGDGEGRNGVYASQNGWSVTSADFSEIAIKRAKEFASSCNVEINFIFSNLITEELQENKFDVLGISFLHFNGKNKGIVHRKLGRTLKIGGYVILECFSESQIKLNSGGPRKKDSLYNIQELKEYYSNFEFIELEDNKVTLKEGDAHIGDAYVVRMFARKETA
ncbi:MAG: class I SAM-dependent methyltransferase [Melioribacteraceae bacterium]|nr:class I SAM-dependent methyltransferase [Melioribacteraceae bacterium]